MDEKEPDTPVASTPPLYRLPAELQLQIILHLSYTDLLTLRRTSRPLYALIAVNEAHVVRHYLNHVVPRHAVELYRPSSANLTLSFIARLAHRYRVCDRLARLIAEHLTIFWFRLTTHDSVKRFAKRQQTMRRRMVPPLLTLFHHFETLRALYVHRLAGPDADPQSETVYWEQWECETLESYDARVLLHAHMMFSVLIHSFQLHFRPPSYAGRLERSLRGWTRNKPSERDLIRVIMIGGLREVERLWRIKSYDHRVRALNEWLDGLQRTHPVVKTTSTTTKVETHPGRDQCLPDSTITPNDGSCIKALDMTHPMPPLSQVELDRVLPHLPPMESVWSVAAHHELLVRGAVRYLHFIPHATEFINELVRLDIEDPIAITGLDDDVDHEEEDAAAAAAANVEGTDLLAAPDDARAQGLDIDAELRALRIVTPEWP